MMLNTDLCLAFSGADGKVWDLDAKAQSCCARVAPHLVAGAVVNNRNEYCGGPFPPAGGFLEHRSLCCGGNQSAQECSNVLGGGGRAYEYVKEFAEDDAVWGGAFLAAWTKATTNGFPNFASLAPCNGSSSQPPGVAAFDCMAEAANWELGWSDAKKEYCCKAIGVACMPNFNCQAGATTWMTGWSDAKKKYCCKSVGLGCRVAATAAPYISKVAVQHSGEQVRGFSGSLGAPGLALAGLAGVAATFTAGWAWRRSRAEAADSEDGQSITAILL